MQLLFYKYKKSLHLCPFNCPEFDEWCGKYLPNLDFHVSFWLELTLELFFLGAKLNARENKLPTFELLPYISELIVVVELDVLLLGLLVSKVVLLETGPAMDARFLL